MASPLLGSLAATIYNAMKGIFIDAVLVRDVILPTSPAYDPADPPAPTLMFYDCKAIRDSYSAFDRINTTIATGDSKILVLVNSLSVVPRGNDVIIIDGVEFSVINVSIDAANAVWTIQGRE